MSHDTSPPAATDTIRYGRRAQQWVPVPEWIIAAGLSPQALALYTVLLAHVNHARGDGRAWPGMDVLAELLGYSRRQSVSRYMDELAGIGAVEVTMVRTQSGRRNDYEIHELPPAEYAGVISLSAFHAQRKARIAAAQRGSCATAHYGSCAVECDGSCAVAHQNQTNATRRSELDEPTPSDVSAATSPPVEARSPQALTDDGQSAVAVKLYLPSDFADLSDNRALEAMIRSAHGALREVGMEPAPDARDRLNRGLRRTLDEHGRESTVDRLIHTLNLAGTADETWGSLAAPMPRAS